MQDSSATKSSRWLELFLLSMVSLYLELLVIRWLSADFRAFTVFKTFPLVTCFVGLGLGYALSDKKYFRWTQWSLVLFIAILQLAEYFGFWQWTFPSVSVFSWGMHEFSGMNLWLYVCQFIVVLLVLLAGPFLLMACLGAKLGSLFNELPPLPAYCVNIGGSILGSLIFSGVAFLGWTPWMALIPAAVLISIYLPQPKVFWKVAPLIIAIGLAAWVIDPSPNVVTYWSPYQRLDTYPFMVSDLDNSKVPDNWGITIAANGHFYLHGIGLSAADLNRTDLPAKVLSRLQEHARNYNFPYSLKHGKHVLILGAGAGNNVAAALRNGAEHVDAVDIDPIIIKLGRESHPEHPYSSEKVTVICDDARDFLNNCKTSYDMIIFAGLDSLTVTGKGASVRLDNYVYTKESIQRALSLLDKNDGLMVLSFCKSKDWLSKRMYCTIQAAAGYPPIVVSDTTSPELPWQTYLSGPFMQHLKSFPVDIAPFAVHPIPEGPCGRILTDDWPFVYVSQVEFDIPYLLTVAIILAISFMATHKILRTESSGVHWQMFFLGAAFLLLELQSIARLSLVYGSTWLTSAIVINGVLLMILAANLSVIKLGDRVNWKPIWNYGFLAIALIASYFLPFRELLGSQDWWTGHLLVTLITLLPMLGAGVIFAVAFRNVKKPSTALSFNLLGAVVGAMLEYGSNYVGISGLVVIAGLLYLCSFLALNTHTKMAVDNL